MNGRMLRIAILKVEVPRHFDAKLYSLSRMITTCVRKKKAMNSQPVMVSANTILQNDGPMIMTSTAITSSDGRFAMME